MIKKNEVDCLRYTDGLKLSLNELYHLSKIECNYSYLKKLGLDGSSMIKKETACKKRRVKIMSNGQERKNEYVRNARPR